MKIILLARETFPTDEILTVENINSKKILNPYDEFALQKISEIKDAEITVILLSKSEDTYCLKTCLGLGAHIGRQVVYGGNNPREIKKILIEEIKRIKNFDLIVSGSSDVNNMREELPFRISRSLNIPIVSHVIDFKINEDNEVWCRKEKDETIEEVILRTPAFVSVGKNVYEPKYPSIHDIMNISSKPISVVCYKEKNNLNCELKINDVDRRKEIYSGLKKEESTDKIMNFLDEWGLTSGLYEYISLFRKK